MLNKKILLVSGLLISFVGCGGGGSSSSSTPEETFTTYKVKVVDDGVVGATVEAKGCKNTKSLTSGLYSFECSAPPKYIMAKGGFVDINKNGIQDKNEVSMGLPLLLNLDSRFFDVNLSDIAVTPLSTLVANIENKLELKSLALKLGIDEKSFIKDISSSHKDLFQKLNALLIIADSNGMNNQLLLMRKLRENIKASSSANLADILSDAINALKNDSDLKKAYGELFISGFIDESSTAMGSHDILGELAAGVASDQVLITGFIYDAIIKNANIVILDGTTEVGKVQSNEKGRWKISIKKSILAADKVLLFTGTAIDDNGDKILLKSAITTKYLREIAKKRISIADSIDLVISNVTTAQVAILDKNDKDFAKKPNELDEKKNKIEIFQREVLLKTSAAIKAVIDGTAKIGQNEDTYSFIVDNLVVTDSKNDTVKLELNGAISQEELDKQKEAIKKDAILAQQLLTIESEKPLSPILDKSLYTIQYSGATPVKKYIKTVITTDSLTESFYRLNGNSWVKTDTKVHKGRISRNVFYFDEDPLKAPLAVTLKETRSVHNVEVNKDYTFDILAKQLYKPYGKEDSTKVTLDLYSESFDVVSVFKELDESDIHKGLPKKYFSSTEEEQNLALSSFLINRISKEPEPFDRNATKLNSAIAIVEGMDIENDNVEVKLNEVRTTLNSADSDDKDAQVGKALFALAEVTNSQTVGDLVELTLNGTTVSTSSNLPSILEGTTGKDLEVRLLSNISDLSETSMTVIHDIVLKLQDINATLGKNFADATYQFKYKDVTFTHNQSLLLRASILAAASKLEYLAAFDLVNLDDVKTRTTTINGVTVEYDNISANPLPIFNRSDVGALNSTVGASRLSHAKSLLLESIDVLGEVVSSKISDAQDRQDIIDAKQEAVKIKVSLLGSAPYVVEDEEYAGYVTKTYVDLSALYEASTALDMTHTVGHDLKYDGDWGYDGYRAGAFNEELSQLHNSPISNEWIHESNGSKLSYTYFHDFPELSLEAKTIPLGSASHIPSVITKIEILESGETPIVNTGDNVIKYLFNDLDIDRPYSHHSFNKSEDIDLFYSVRRPLIPDSSVRYGVDFLYGGDKFMLKNPDPVKGEVHVVGKSGFTGEQCFALDVYDTLGHTEQIHECVYIQEPNNSSGNDYDNAQAIDKSQFPTLRYLLNQGVRKFEMVSGSNIDVSEYDSGSSSWTVVDNFDYHFDANQLVIDSNNDGIEDYRIKYVNKVTDIKTMNSNFGEEVLSAGAEMYELIIKKSDGSIYTTNQFNETAKEQYFSFYSL